MLEEFFIDPFQELGKNFGGGVYMWREKGSDACNAMLKDEQLFQQQTYRF